MFTPVSTLRISLLVLVTFSASLLPTGLIAQEDKTPEIIIIDMTEERENSAPLYEMIKQEVAKRVDYKFKEIDAIIDAGSIEEHLNNVSMGEELFKEGFQRFFGGEYEAAAESFEQAMKLYEESYAYLISPADLLNSKLYLGSAYFLAGKVKQAEESFVSVLLFKPDSELTSASTQDDLQIFFESVKEKVARLRKGSVYINTYPAGARIEVDGVFKGTTPLPVEGLKVGEHYISAKLDGYSRFSQKIRVNDEFEEKYDFTLKQARKKKIFEDIVAKLRVSAVSGVIDGSASLSELKGMFFSDYAILMDCRCKQTPKKLKMYFVNLFTKKLISSIKYPQKSDAPEIDRVVVAGLVDELFGAEEKRIKKLVERAESAAVKPQKRTIFSKWWFWTLLGGAALGSVSAVLLLTKGGESQGFDHDGSGALIIRF